MVRTDARVIHENFVCGQSQQVLINAGAEILALTCSNLKYSVIQSPRPEGDALVSEVYKEQLFGSIHASGVKGAQKNCLENDGSDGE